MIPLLSTYPYNTSHQKEPYLKTVLIQPHQQPPQLAEIYLFGANTELTCSASWRTELSRRAGEMPARAVE